MPTIQIRTAVPEDVQAVSRIQIESWWSAFADILTEQTLEDHLKEDAIEQMYRHVLADERFHGLLLTLDGQPHAMAFWSAAREEQTPGLAELICIHSLKENWGKGYGSQLMERALAEMKAAGYREVLLWVFEQNLRARRFYEKFGFSLSGQQQNNLGANEIQYRKTL